MTAKTLKEAAADVLGGNVKSKRGSADKAQRLPGEVQDLGAPVVKPDTAKGPDATKGVSKDSSKSSKSQVGQEKVHKMKNKQSVPMQEDDYLDDEELLDEVEYLTDEEMDALEEAERQERANHKKKSDDTNIDTEPTMGEDEEYEYDDDDYLEEDEEYEYDEEYEDDEEIEEEFELPSMDDIELDISEDVAAMFEGQELSDEFMDKAAFVFETAVRANLKKYESQLIDMFEDSLNDAAAVIKEEMEDEVNKYLSYVVEEWVSENEVAIETGLKNELTEDFMSGLRNLFTEHYIEIPEGKVDVLEAQSERIDELQDRLNESIEYNANLVQDLKESTRENVFNSLTEDLTDVQASKILELSEKVEFDSEDEFAEKLGTLIESYYPGNRPSTMQMIDEEALDNPEDNAISEELDGEMAQFVNAIRKTNK